MASIFSSAKTRADIDYQRAVSNSEYLSKKYGGTEAQWKGLATASLIGADLVDSYSKWANANLMVQGIEAKQQEIEARADVSIANIFADRDKVQAAQKAAYIKSGVKLEGSALTVLAQTASDALEAAEVRQQEADFQNAILERQKAIAEVQADLAPMEFVINAGSSYARGNIF